MKRVEVNISTGERKEIDLSASEVAAAKAITEAEKRAYVPKKIEADRDAAFLSGVEWNGRRWHLDATFQYQITGLVTAYEAGILPADETVSIRAMDNTTHDLTQAQVKALAGVVLSRVQTIWQESWTAKDAVRNENQG